MPIIQNWELAQQQDFSNLALKFNNIFLDNQHAEFLGQVKWGKKTLSPEIEALNLVYERSKVYKFYRVNSEILCTIRHRFSFRVTVGYHYAVAIGTSESHWFEYLGLLVHGRVMISPEYPGSLKLIGDFLI